MTDARIILGAQPPQILNALSQSNDMAARQLQVNRQREAHALYRTHGAGIAQGDQNALNALAGIDPMAASQLRRQGVADEQRSDQIQYQRGRDARADQMADRQLEMQVAQYARQIGAQEAAKQAEETQRSVFAASAAQTPEQWDQVVSQFGANDLVGQFENREVLLRQYMTAAQILAQQSGPEPLTDDGKRAVDVQNGFIDPNAPPSVDLGEVDKFRKEFSGLPAVKNFSAQTEGIQRIVASASDPSAAGDLALIFNFMKVLDPTSVVRESEFATAEQARAWLQKSEQLGITVPGPVAGAIRKMASGEKLSDEQRTDFVGTASRIYQGSEQEFQNIRGQFQNIAESRGYPVDQSLIDFSFSGELPGGQQSPQAPTGSQVPAPNAGGFQFQNDNQRRLFEQYAPAPSGAP